MCTHMCMCLNLPTGSVLFSSDFFQILLIVGDSVHWVFIGWITISLKFMLNALCVACILVTVGKIVCGWDHICKASLLLLLCGSVKNSPLYCSFLCSWSLLMQKVRSQCQMLYMASLPLVHLQTTGPKSRGEECLSDPVSLSLDVSENIGHVWLS